MPAFLADRWLSCAALLVTLKVHRTSESATHLAADAGRMPAILYRMRAPPLPCAFRSLTAARAR
jgi:hypothetical protein